MARCTSAQVLPGLPQGTETRNRRSGPLDPPTGCAAQQIDGNTIWKEVVEKQLSVGCDVGRRQT